MRKSKSQKGGISLRGRVTLAFALFVLIVLAVLWLFQTVLLDDLYRSVRLRDLDRCADTFALAATDICSFNQLTVLSSDTVLSSFS